MIEVFPTKFEAMDVELEDGVFKVEASDEVCATITIDVPVSLELWDEIAPMIRQCLVDMKLEGP